MLEEAFRERQTLLIIIFYNFLKESSFPLGKSESILLREIPEVLSDDKGGQWE